MKVLASVCNLASVGLKNNDQSRRPPAYFHQESVETESITLRRRRFRDNVITDHSLALSGIQAHVIDLVDDDDVMPDRITALSGIPTNVIDLVEDDEVTTDHSLALSGVPTNVITLVEDDDEYNYLVTRNAWNYDVNADSPDGEVWEMPMLDYDTMIHTLGTGDENKPKLDKKFLMTYPKITIQETEVCAICQNDISKGEEVYFLRCGQHKTVKTFHPYHCDCLSKWINDYSGTNCPTCKFSWLN